MDSDDSLDRSSGGTSQLTWCVDQNCAKSS